VTCEESWFSFIGSNSLRPYLRDLKVNVHGVIQLKDWIGPHPTYAQPAALSLSLLRILLGKLEILV
jgi:hypothetical protein